MKISFVLASAVLLATAQAVAIPSKRPGVDCEKAVPRDASKVLKGECKVLCIWARDGQAPSWEEFDENCKA
ncbi:hypothetical protein TWF718_007907 [Orbilia javanica]|uniref:Uncharacterized protein n=1 Tax=Orbilia javanica TaxID=47235 RepID=A0AAN8MW26_9PEZI